MKLKSGLLLVAFILLSAYGFAQGTPPDPGSLTGGEFTNVITTAVPFLSISPDARHAALGDAGVASSPDANSAYWNAAKLVFIDKAYGGSISYTPWLGKIISDMNIYYLSGFYKINREQAISASMKYFDLGDIAFRDINNNSTGDFNPKEFSFDFTYSRMLTENFSIGITGKYIHSNLTGNFSGNGGSDAKPASTAAADLGLYYTKTLEGAKNSNLSLGASISNIGGKVSYSNTSNKDFLPTTLRLGGAYTTELDPYNSFTFLLDFNKLMVPTIDNNDKSVLSGMFGSFSDAPGGGKEELHEVITSAGVEYWYNKTFAARLGYFLEAKDKGNRKYMTVGLGFRSKKAFGIDLAYLVPTNKRDHPLAETIRYTLVFHINQKTVVEESVTD